MKNAGIFLSGTGNTKHCLELMLEAYDSTAPIFPLEDSETTKASGEAETIFLAYPTQFSNAPKMVRDWIQKSKQLWNGKKVFLLATMGLFSGDATGCAARPLWKLEAKIVGGRQVKMPDSVSDSRLLKKSRDENLHIIQAADRKIQEAVDQMRAGRFPQEGLSGWAHLSGLFGQRLWFRSRTADYSKDLIVSDQCVGCGRCEKLCPMHNIQIKQGSAEPQGRCTMCYRCISSCPRQAITLLGDKVVEQYRFDDYQEQL